MSRSYDAKLLRDNPRRPGETDAQYLPRLRRLRRLQLLDEATIALDAYRKETAPLGHTIALTALIKLLREEADD